MANKTPNSGPNVASYTTVDRLIWGPALLCLMIDTGSIQTPIQFGFRKKNPVVHSAWIPNVRYLTVLVWTLSMK